MNEKNQRPGFKTAQTVSPTRAYIKHYVKAKRIFKGNEDTENSAKPLRIEIVEEKKRG